LSPENSSSGILDYRSCEDVSDVAVWYDFVSGLVQWAWLVSLVVRPMLAAVGDQATSDTIGLHGSWLQ